MGINLLPDGVNVKAAVGQIDDLTSTTATVTTLNAAAANLTAATIDALTLTQADETAGSPFTLANAAKTTLNSSGYTGATGQSVDVSAQTTTPIDVKFSDDGLRMYVLGYGSDTIYQYTLTTAYDVSTASYASISLNVGAAEATPTCFFFGASGSVLYVLGSTNDTIHVWTLGSEFDISDAMRMPTWDFSVAAQINVPAGLFFSPDGLKMYVGSMNPSGRIYEYTLGDAWNPSTAGAATSFSVAAQHPALRGFTISPDGTTIVIGGLSETLYQYSMTAWTLSTAAYASISLDINPMTSGTVAGMTFTPDGSKLVVTLEANGLDAVAEVTLEKQYTNRIVTWFAGFGWVGTADGYSTANVGPTDFSQLELRAVYPFRTTCSLFQVRKSATGTYILKAPTGLDFINDLTIISVNTNATSGNRFITYRRTAADEITFYSWLTTGAGLDNGGICVQIGRVT